MTETLIEGCKARSWREGRGLSVAALAKLAGLSPSTIHDYEAGFFRRTGWPVEPRHYQRYKLICAALAANLVFDWTSCRIEVSRSEQVDLMAPK